MQEIYSSAFIRRQNSSQKLLCCSCYAAAALALLERSDVSAADDGAAGVRSSCVSAGVRPQNCLRSGAPAFDALLRRRVHFCFGCVDGVDVDAQFHAGTMVEGKQQRGCCNNFWPHFKGFNCKARLDSAGTALYSFRPFSKFFQENREV